MAHGRWSIPVVDRVVDPSSAEAQGGESCRLFIDRCCLSMQAKLFVYGSIVRAAPGRLAREKVLADYNPTCSPLRRLSVGYGIVLGRYLTTNFPVEPSIYGGRELPKLRNLARYISRVLLGALIEHKRRTTAAS